VLALLNQVDYSLVNQLSRVEKPTCAIIGIGQMLCEFLHFVKDPVYF